MESQARLSHLPGVGTEPADQAQETDHSGEAGTVVSTGSHQSVLVNGLTC
jgi:hypothetical protein